MAETFYRYSPKRAKDDCCIELWRDSRAVNRECAKFIDSRETGLSATAYKDNRVDANYAKTLVDKFGYERTMNVIAHQIISTKDDGRWSKETKEWAKSIWCGQNKSFESCYLNTHPGLLDILAKHVKQLHEDLKLYDSSHCDMDEREYQGKIVLISPYALNEEYWSGDDQICVATCGFGCSATATGRAVYATCLKDMVNMNLHRGQIIGVMKDEFVPDWARENYAKLYPPEQEQDQSNQPTLG